MSKLPGLQMHCDVIEVLIEQELPELSEHFKDRGVSIFILAQNWIMTCFT